MIRGEMDGLATRRGSGSEHPEPRASVVLDARAESASDDLRPTFWTLRACFQFRGTVVERCPSHMSRRR
jgi:hypothetical protein